MAETRIPLTADAYVLAASPTTNFGSAIMLLVQRSLVKGVGEVSRTLFKATLDGVVPPGSTINSLKMDAWISGVSLALDWQANDGTAWTEADVTWDTRPTPTGGVITDLSSPTSVPKVAWLSADLKALLVGNELNVSLRVSASNGGDLEMESREAIAGHPEISLVVDYTPPPASGTRLGLMGFF